MAKLLGDPEIRSDIHVIVNTIQTNIPVISTVIKYILLQDYLVLSDFLV